MGNKNGKHHDTKKMKQKSDTVISVIPSVKPNTIPANNNGNMIDDIMHNTESAAVVVNKPAVIPSAKPNTIPINNSSLKSLVNGNMHNDIINNIVSGWIYETRNINTNDPTIQTVSRPPPPPYVPPPPVPKAAAPVLTKEEEIKLAKYTRMKKMRLPEGAIRNKMKQDGIDSGLIDTFFNGIDFHRNKKTNTISNTHVQSYPLSGVKKENKLAKYTRMKKMRLPEKAIRNKMKQDGIDSGLIDTFFNGIDFPK
eukprot:26303_1